MGAESARMRCDVRRRGDKSLQHIAATIRFVCNVKQQVIAVIAAL